MEVAMEMEAAMAMEMEMEMEVAMEMEIKVAMEMEMETAMVSSDFSFASKWLLTWDLEALCRW